MPRQAGEHKSSFYTHIGSKLLSRPSSGGFHNFIKKTRVMKITPPVSGKKPQSPYLGTRTHSNSKQCVCVSRERDCSLPPQKRVKKDGFALDNSNTKLQTAERSVLKRRHSSFSFARAFFPCFLGEETCSEAFLPGGGGLFYHPCCTVLPIWPELKRTVSC